MNDTEFAEWVQRERRARAMGATSNAYLCEGCIAEGLRGNAATFLNWPAYYDAVTNKAHCDRHVPDAAIHRTETPAELTLEEAAKRDNYCPRCRVVSFNPSPVSAFCACGDEAWVDCCADQQCTSCGMPFQVPARDTQDAAELVVWYCLRCKKTFRALFHVCPDCKGSDTRLASEDAASGTDAEVDRLYEALPRFKIDDTERTEMPYCEPCGSYHPVPRNAEHKAALMCVAGESAASGTVTCDRTIDCKAPLTHWSDCQSRSEAEGAAPDDTPKHLKLWICSKCLAPRLYGSAVECFACGFKIHDTVEYIEKSVADAQVARMEHQIEAAQELLRIRRDDFENAGVYALEMMLNIFDRELPEGSIGADACAAARAAIKSAKGEE